LEGINVTWNGSGMTPPRLPEPRRPKPKPTAKPAAQSTAKPTTKPSATAGSPGRTVRQPVQLATTETAAGSWLRGLRLSGFSFVMMGILVLAVIVLAPSLRTYAEQRQQIDDLRASVAAQEADVDNLKDERERWNDRTFVTTQARDRLSYVMPGDVSFLVLNDTGATVDGSADTANVSAAIQDTEVDWVDSVFRSVMTAGLAPQEAAQ
jgi:cell division protein FtsB